MHEPATSASVSAGVLDRATVTARRAAVHAELLEAMRHVERYKGALALLDDLLQLEDAPPPEDIA
jgi:hypothetical protein